MSAPIIIKNARVVAPGAADAPVLPEPVDVLVAGERVAAVGPGLAAAFAGAVAAGHAQLVDAAGRLVAPGLIDAHVHLTGGGGESGFASRVPRVMLSALASAGVTSVVGVLGTDGATRTMRDLVATTLGLREEGLSAWCYTGNYAVPVVTLTGSVKDDVVFIDPVVGVGELAISDHRSSQPTLAELLRVASEAYVGGLTARKAGLVHLHLGDGPRGLDLVRRALAEAELPARVWQPTHLNRNPALWREAMELAAAGGRLPLFDVTAFPADDLGGAVSAAEAIAAWREAGLPFERLSCSSDGGGCLPTFDADGRLLAMGVGASATLLETVRALVGGGTPLAAALAPVTVNPARALLLDGRKGAVAPGWDADLVIFDADDPQDARLPLAAVMARGRWLVESGRVLAAGRGAFEAGEGGGG